MRWSLRVATVSGIPIYIHWTFLILIGWIVLANAAAGPLMAGLSVLFILALFLCVGLHELGHALMGQRFGVRTRDITLLPIGGVARLERIPENPTQELLIAAAGPAVNVAIALFLFLGLAAAGSAGLRPLVPGGIAAQLGAVGFVPLLINFNIFLVVFNLIPAFPMDGGRILRALLAYRLDYARATRIAAGVGQVMAILFAFWGLMVFNPFLLLIAVFVFLGAQAEASLAEVRYGLSDLPVRDAMLTQFSVLHPGDTLAAAAGALLAGTQQDFPVMDNGAIVGILPRADLVRALAEHGDDTPVAAVMRRDCGTVEENERLYKVFERMQNADCPLVPVTRRGVLVGLVTLENVGELMMVRSALRRRRGGPAAPSPDPETGPRSLNFPRSA
jgi:Zn-dependent protease